MLDNAALGSETRPAGDFPCMTWRRPTTLHVYMYVHAQIGIGCALVGKVAVPLQGGLWASQKCNISSYEGLRHIDLPVHSHATVVSGSSWPAPPVVYGCSSASAVQQLSTLKYQCFMP